MGLFVVVGGTASKDDCDDGTASDEIPGWRFARPGDGGGGINWESVRIGGMSFDDEARWALPRAGKAGGESSSLPVSPLSPSSLDGGGDTSRMTGAVGDLGSAVPMSSENQPRR